VLQAYHDDYRSLDWAQLYKRGCQVVLDGRNALDSQAVEQAGMRYIGIG
jgi:UDP-N-acetyl-D-mannosaminuronate dehydrogenase